MVLAIPSLGRRVRLRVFVWLALTALMSGLLAAPASAGPNPGSQPFYPVAAAAFAVAPAVGAPIGNTVVLWGTGSATATVDLAGPARRLVFSAQAQPCEGSPRLEVRVDGKVVHGREVAGSGSYAVPGSWTAGRHSLTFAYLNDRLSATCDRNLRIRLVAFWGPHTRYGALAVFVSQEMDLRVVAFSPASAGLGSTGTAMLWSTGLFTGALDSQDADYLYIRIRPTACAGMPRFSLRIDGTLVTEQAVLAPNGPAESSYFKPGTWKNGMHTVEIAYLNEVRTATCDRNLDVLSVSFSGYV
jgi:Ca-dependent carbohydrate-binding module xylan-binding